MLEVTPDLADKLHITTPSDRQLLDRVPQFRTELVDTCLEQNDEAMEAFLTDGTVPSADILRACLRKGTLNSAFTPVLCGSSYKNKGVQQVLDAVVDYLPAPTDVPSIKTVDADGEPIGERATSDDEPFSALAFKVINDAYGALTFIRVYSGVLTKGASVQNSTRGKREKIGRMVEMFAKEANPVEEARAGDIIALVRWLTRKRATPCAMPRIPWCWNACVSPNPSSACRSRRRTSPNRKNSARRSAKWFAPTLHCTSKPTAKRVKPSCAAWASCTSR